MISERFCRVLIAGGSKRMQLSLGQLFSGGAQQLIFADTAEAVVSQVIGFSPDLVIIDLSLAGSGGIEIVRRIRSFTSDMSSVVQASEVAIIVIAEDRKDESLAREAARLRVAAVLFRPFSLNDLADKIRELSWTGSADKAGGIKTILVVDCEPRVRELYENIFAGLRGYDVVTVADAMHALEQVEFKNPDLIISEQNLPDMSGLDLLKSLNEIGKKIPVIFVSSAGSDDVVRQAKELGARSYVLKPFIIDRLKRLVRDTLQETTPAGVVATERVDSK